MNELFKIIIIGSLSFVCVIQPLRMRSESFLAVKSGFTLPDQAALLSEAISHRDCPTELIDQLGTIYVDMKNMTMATVSFGQAMLCSPANALIRYKFGQMLLAQQFIEGREYVYQALKLETNNPYFKNESTRLRQLSQ